MASISNSRLILILVVALVGVIAILLLGALLGLGLMFIGLALVLPMSAKWRFAFLVNGSFGWPAAQAIEDRIVALLTSTLAL